MFGRLFRRTSRADAAGPLYGAVVAQARQPEFYQALGVPDTVDGRFDMVTLHAFLVMRRLQRADAASSATAQALFDYMFADMDRNLREMGAGDMGVARRVKIMVQAFFGRVAAYDAALEDSGPALEQALKRNLYREDTGEDADATAVAALSAYVRREAAGLEGQDPVEVGAGRVIFGPVMVPPYRAAPHGEA